MLITHEKFNPKNIRYGFLTKKISGSSHRYLKQYDNHAENNKLAAEIFGSEQIAVVEQKHTNKVILTNDYNNYCIADAQVSNKANIALGVLTADCVPILLCDDEAKIISSVHSGWRGARSDIIQNTIEAMQELGAKNITAIIGPCIQQHSYEVCDNFYQNFISESSNNKQFFIPGKKEVHHMFDLPSYVKHKLTHSAVDQILDIERNTYDNEEHFFSFRRTTHNPESQMGSLISVIMLT